MDRRGFIGSILAACAAPAIVRADSLMRIVPRGTGVLTLDMVTREALSLLETSSLSMWSRSRVHYYAERNCLVAVGDSGVHVMRIGDFSVA